MAFPAWDYELSIRINQAWRNGFFDSVMPLLSSSAVLWVIVGVGVWYRSWFAAASDPVPAPGRSQARRALVRFLLLAAMLLIVAGVSDLSCNLVKDSVGRVRPLYSVPGVWFQNDGEWTRRPLDFVQTKERGNSFPSAHAANSAAAALTAVFVSGGPRPWPLLALPLLVGYSRIYLGKHFPLDIVGGWLLGLMIFLAGRGLLRLLLLRLERRRPGG